MLMLNHTSLDRSDFALDLFQIKRILIGKRRPSTPGIPPFVKLSVTFLFCFALAIPVVAENPGSVANPATTAVLTTLYTFCGDVGCPDSPSSSLIQGLDGNFYGTAIFGGNVNQSLCAQGCGTVYKITPTGALTTVYNFCSLANCGDGFYPASLLLATDGNFYGVTQYGGISDDNCPPGCGTVFRLTPQGILTTLYSLDPDDSVLPQQLIQGSDGNFYGMAWELYFNQILTEVFQLTPQGKFNVIYPLSEVYFTLSFQAPTGIIYGTTYPECDQYCYAYGGTAFEMIPSGALTTIYNFCPAETDCTNGSYPTALFRATDGDFYGSMYAGGNLNNPFCGVGFGCGLVFKLSPGGSAKTLYTFCPGTDCWNGLPISLMQATDGNLYGTTSPPPSTTSRRGRGTVFEISTGGAFTTLYKFCPQIGCTDGAYPSNGLIQATDGAFYGTTSGGDNIPGTIFSLSLGLSPFVKTLPTSGEVGKPVYILGTKLTGATEVTFNGVAANFTVVSRTEITTMVPKGATNGVVTVTTPAGTLSSNVKFMIP